MGRPFSSCTRSLYQWGPTVRPGRINLHFLLGSVSHIILPRPPLDVFDPTQDFQHMREVLRWDGTALIKPTQSSMSA